MTPDQQAKIAEYAAKYEIVTQKINDLEITRAAKKKMVRMQTDEVSRLQAFRGIKVTRADSNSTQNTDSSLL